jgi:hypothetical protein
METLAKVQLSCAEMALLGRPMAAVVCIFIVVADIGTDGT